jgi:hypothetical protein
MPEAQDAFVASTEEGGSVTGEPQGRTSGGVPMLRCAIQKLFHGSRSRLTQRENDIIRYGAQKIVSDERIDFYYKNKY